MFQALTQRFKAKPTIYYALSICATWAGIGSLMNGVTMTQTYGILPSLIWVFGNVIACILFGAVALKIPRVREVFGSRDMRWICGLMCVFQAWLSMNGTQAVFADTPLGGVFFGVYMAIIFLLAWAQFTPALNIIKAFLITIIGASTLSSSMYSIYIAFGKKVGLAVNAGLIALWAVLIPLGVMGMWTLMASVRIYFVAGGILFAILWHLVDKSVRRSRTEGASAGAQLQDAPETRDQAQRQARGDERKAVSA